MRPVSLCYRWNPELDRAEYFDYYEMKWYKSRQINRKNKMYLLTKKYVKVFSWYQTYCEASDSYDN